MGVNIRLHLSREGEELAGGAAGGATLEFVFEKEVEEEVAEQEEEGEAAEQQEEEEEVEEAEGDEGCDSDREENHVTDSYSAGSGQTPHSDPSP